MAESGRRSRPRLPKLRSACNQCNAAKTRCSGERDGCGRCQGLQVDCVYIESRVGRVQGPRGKRKKMLGSSNSTNNQIKPHDKSQEITVASSTNVRSLERNIDDSLEQALQKYTTEPWDSGTWDDQILALGEPIDMFNGVFGENVTTGTKEPRARSHPETITPCSDSDGSEFYTDPSGISVVLESGIPGLEVDPGLTILSPPSDTEAPGLPPLPSPVSIPSVPPHVASHTTTALSDTMARPVPRHVAKIDSRCVLACTQIITTLENYILSELKVLDLILSTVRSVTAEVNRIMQHQQESRGERCMMLFVTIMHQIIELLEVGSRSLLEGGSDEDVEAGIMSCGGHPSFVPQFGFGAFSVNDEQKFWRSRAILKEYQNIGELLAKVSALAKVGPIGVPTTPEAIEQRLRCLVRLEQRLRSMQERLKG